MSEERLNELFSIINEGYPSIQEQEIRDYITNLQEENVRFREIICFNEDYKSRIDKAIEYIKEHIRIDDEYPAYMEMLVEEKNELLNILGGDKE